MRIAIVGAGTRCIYLMDLIEKHNFQIVLPVIVGVADLRDDAEGMVRARQSNLFVTNDYNDFFVREDIDLIVELTGDLNIYNDILTKKKKDVRAIAHTTALLFWEISRVSTLQEETRQRLHEKQAMYDVMINDMIQEDVIVIASDYRILDANDTFLKKIGLKHADVIGRFCYEVTHHQSSPCTGELHPCPLDQAIKTRKPSQATHVHLDKDKNELHYSISCYPLMENDRVEGVIEVSKDITKDIQIQKGMMQQEKMVSIGRLSAGVAHEINNPLTTILTSSMLLQEEMEEDSPLSQELKTISNEALRCRKIVKSLLDFSRQTKPAKMPSNINDVVTESFVLTRKQAAFNDVMVEADLAETLPRINIDKDQIQQAVINLALNAVEATPPGGKVLLNTRHLSNIDKIEVCVSDTGVGIPHENQDKIFDPFFTTREDGTGLGLAITHGIVEQHGGTIHVKSRSGEGTSFFIWLPLDTGEHHDA